MSKSQKRRFEKKEVVHTRLDRPIFLRKQTLKAAIDATKLMKEYAELKLIREERTRVYKMLQELYVSINNRMKKLETKDLPKLQESYKKETQHEKVEQEHENLKVKVESPKTKEDMDIQKLKTELEQIEKKLKQL